MDQTTSQGWQQQWSPQPQQDQQQPGAYGHYLSPGQQAAYGFQPHSPQPQGSQTSTPNGMQYGQEFQQFGMYPAPATNQVQQHISPPIVSEDYDQIMAALQEGFPGDEPQQAGPSNPTPSQAQQILSPHAFQQYLATLSPNSAKDAYMHFLQPTYASPPPAQPQQANASQVQPQQQYQMQNGQPAQFSQLPAGYTYPFPMTNGADQAWGAFGLGDAGSSDSMMLDPSLVMNPTAAPSFSSQPSQQQQQSQHTISPEMLHPRPQLANPRTIHLPDSLSPQPLLQTHGVSATASPPASSSMPRRPSQQTSKSASSSSKSSHSGLDPLLSPEKLDQNPSAVASQLLIQLTGKKTDPPDLETRLKVLRTLREHAPERFWKAWAKDKNAVEMLKGWLDDVLNDERPRAEVMMPLLQVIERIPMTIDALRTTKIGQSVRRAVKASPTTAIKDVAQKLETRWKEEITKHLASGNKDSDKESTPLGDSAKKRVAVTAEEARKKRKVEQTVASSSKPVTAGPVSVKKPTAAVTKTVTVNKPKPTTTTTTATTTVKGATGDSGFFTTSKPKSRLPSFKKTSAVTSVTDLTKDGAAAEKPKVAVNNADAFQEALKSLNKKSGIGDKSTPPVEGKSDGRDGSAAPPEPAKAPKKKKSVTFAAGDNLRQIKMIEPAVYDDDEYPPEHHESARDLDRAEGRALAHAIFDEEIDWYEPEEIEFPNDPPDMFYERGTASQEKTAQDVRESSVEPANYDLPDSIPDSPQEPANVPTATPDDANVQHLKVPPNMLDVEPEGDEDDSAAKSVPNVADLLKQISGGMHEPSQASTQQPASAAAVPPANTLANLGIDTARLASILAQAGMTSTPTPPPQPPGMGDQQTHVGGSDWNQGGNQAAGWGGGAFNEGGYGQADNNGFNRGQSDQGWNSRGRGQARGGRGGPGRPHQKPHRRIPCQFYQQGRCRNGDDCDFLHVDA